MPPTPFHHSEFNIQHSPSPSPLKKNISQICAPRPCDNSNTLPTQSLHTTKNPKNICAPAQTSLNSKMHPKNEHQPPEIIPTHSNLTAYKFRSPPKNHEHLNEHLHEHLATHTVVTPASHPTSCTRPIERHNRSATAKMTALPVHLRLPFTPSTPAFCFSYQIAILPIPNELLHSPITTENRKPSVCSLFRGPKG